MFDDIRMTGPGYAVFFLEHFTNVISSLSCNNMYLKEFYSRSYQWHAFHQYHYFFIVQKIIICLDRLMLLLFFIHSQHEIKLIVCTWSNYNYYAIFDKSKNFIICIKIRLQLSAERIDTHWLFLYPCTRIKVYVPVHNTWI